MPTDISDCRKTISYNLFWWRNRGHVHRFRPRQSASQRGLWGTVGMKGASRWNETCPSPRALSTLSTRSNTRRHSRRVFILLLIYHFSMKHNNLIFFSFVLLGCFFSVCLACVFIWAEFGTCIRVNLRSGFIRWNACLRAGITAG